MDDDQATRHLYGVALAGAGYDVDLAADGEQGWEALLSAHYDLLLTDHNMPRLTGLALAARMRAAGFRIPIIVNSGCPEFVGEPDHWHLGELELAAVLQKPLGLTELVDAVGQLLPPPAVSATTTTSDAEPAVPPVDRLPAIGLLPQRSAFVT